MIFSSLYNAPISYYAILLRNRKMVTIEQYDHYTKQTYRNRCRILGANGTIDLVIPVVKMHGQKVFMKDVRIDYDTNWRKIHWKSIVSAYASAPFFEFMDDTFSKFYYRKYTFLIDLNMDLLLSTLDLLQVSAHINRSTSYLPVDRNRDTREAIHPKRDFYHTNYTYQPVEYHQVFLEKHSFKADLSILDLLFNEGPNAGTVLATTMNYQEKTRSE